MLLGIAVLLLVTGCGEPQKVKVNSLEITNVFRNCEKNEAGNYVDTTIQTTVNFDIKTSKKYSLKFDR